MKNEKQREKVLSLTRKDFKIDWFSGTGAGGQHRNKHQNCCRITHIETGTTAQCVDHKDRPSNQRVAFHRLAERMRPWLEEKTRRTVHIPGKTEDVIRSYNVPDNRVKDHASGEMFSWDEVTKNFDSMVSARHSIRLDRN